MTTNYQTGSIGLGRSFPEDSARPAFSGTDMTTVSAAYKIRTADELVGLWRISRPRIVAFTNGCFDLLHIGHVRYLELAKNEGDVLVVGLNSDASVRAIKGPSRPVNRQEDRAAVLAALEAVDYVVLFHEPTPQRLIEALSPDVVVKGADWQDKQPVAGQQYVEAHGGRMVFVPLVPNRSTTQLIQRIAEMG